ARDQHHLTRIIHLPASTINFLDFTRLTPKNLHLPLGKSLSSQSQCACFLCANFLFLYSFHTSINIQNYKVYLYHNPGKLYTVKHGL
ncbi:MAG: hypothetical protein MUF15_17470, partial [Acidobacteria bacterium]|nr:hypothetical protein [Acidobacteriota bacterium]